MFKNKNIRSLKWFYVWVLIMAAWMVYANFTGWRVFTVNNAQTWSASGSGYHK